MITYINRIAYTAAANLAGVAVWDDGRLAAVPSAVPFAELPIVGLASLSVSSTVEEGERQWESTLECVLRCAAPPLDHGVAYLLTDVRGRRYVLGHGGQPYPATLPSEGAGGKPSEGCAARLTVEWVSPLRPAEACFY